MVNGGGGGVGRDGFKTSCCVVSIFVFFFLCIQCEISLGQMWVAGWKSKSTRPPLVWVVANATIKLVVFAALFRMHTTDKSICSISAICIAVVGSLGLDQRVKSLLFESRRVSTMYHVRWCWLISCHSMHVTHDGGWNWAGKISVRLRLLWQVQYITHP